MKTTNESYQNMTESQRDLKIQKLYSIIEKASLLELKEKISSIRFQNLFNLYMNKITFLYCLPIQIEVTPTATQNKSNLERIKTQINQSFKKISRKILTFKYATFLHTIKKITSKELLLISYINKEKIDLLTRVHSLLVLEHARLYKVAKAS